MVNKSVAETLSFNSFKLQLKNNYTFFFFSLFAYWVVYLVYKAFLSLLGTDTLFTSITNANGLFSILFVLELPLIYLLCVLFIYLLKRMYYPNLKVKDYFYIGLKLFILDLVFLIIVSIFAYLFLVYDTGLYAALLVIFGLLSLFFMFAGYKLIINNNILSAFAKTFKQILNPKAIAYYLVTIIAILVVLGIAAGLVYAGIFPDLVSFLIYPLILLAIFYASNHSVD
jgi:hypothetical protein